MPSWLVTFLGVHNEGGAFYAFWSGFGGSVPDVLIITSMLGWYWHRSCQYSPWCLRLGKFPLAGGLAKACHRHHPDLNGRRPRGAELHRLHREHRAAGGR